MKISQYFSRKINFATADKPAVVEAPLFEELSDSDQTRIVGGQAQVGVGVIAAPSSFFGGQAQVGVGVFAAPSSFFGKIV